MRLSRFLKQEQVDLWFEPLVDTPDPWELPSAEELEASDDGMFELAPPTDGEKVSTAEAQEQVEAPRAVHDATFGLQAPAVEVA